MAFLLMFLAFIVSGTIAWFGVVPRLSAFGPAIVAAVCSTIPIIREGRRAFEIMGWAPIAVFIVYYLVGLAGATAGQNVKEYVVEYQRKKKR